MRLKPVNSVSLSLETPPLLTAGDWTACNTITIC